MKGFYIVAMAAAVQLFACPSASAVETYTVQDAKGAPFIEARFFSTSDGVYTTNESGVPVGSVSNLSPLQQSQVLAGLQKWGQILFVAPGASPAIINIGTELAQNAHASSPLVNYLQIAPTQVQAALQDQDAGTLLFGAHGVIGIGTLDFATTPYIASQLPLNKAGVDLPVVAFHEVGHALGITSSVAEDGNGITVFSPYFDSQLSQWTVHLRDDNGKAAQPGQVIYCTGCVNPSAANVFDVRKDQAYFTGDHVNEVLAGAMPGVPVRMLSDFGNVDSNYMSHIELKNSLMSHQQYRNYTTFMEAELAVMQDLGYNIDRRNFFGSSIYNNGQTVINDNGYYQRNADGTAYLPGTYNLAELGLGLHVYGSDNTVYQRADLLSAGAGGGGIRVDGEGNRLTILPGTRVYADGPYGRGVMFAYGKDHSFVQRGDVQAMGDHGIAASFDFGNNILGNATDYRGSYIHEVSGMPAAFLDEVNGPLVNSFDLTGRLAGRYASIYISDNAYVGQINVMRGASLQGDIVSSYAQKDGLGAQRLTALTFGLMPDADGRSSNVPDPNFALRYDGNIVGVDNLSMYVLGGTTLINGSHAVYDVNVGQGATLSGSSLYVLNAAGRFTNKGTVAPGPAGNSIRISGDYVQTASGQLQLAVTGSGAYSNLAVTGNAALDGTLAIAPQRSWYANNFSFSSDQWLTAGSVSGTFPQVAAVLASPTLTANTTALGGNSYQIAVTRPPGAYSRYAIDASTRQVGGAVDAIAGSAQGGWQSLVAALDFSAADGSAIAPALRQLSPLAYGEMTSGALLRERRITDIVATPRMPGLSDPGQRANAQDGWRAFAIPFASTYQRDRADTAAGSNGNTYGMVIGVDRTLDGQNAWTVGAHAAISGQSTRLDSSTPASGTTTALDAGVHASFVPDPYAGPHAFALARIGIEDGRLDRTVSVNGYLATSQGSWTGGAANAAVEGGWRWRTGDTSSVGALAGLDYTGLYRPALTESGSDSPNLHLDRNTFRSLRTRLGAEVRSEFSLASERKFATHFLATWNREMLERSVTQVAAFDGYPASGFSSRSEVIGRDSVDLQAGISCRTGRDSTIEAALSKILWRGGDADLAGTVSATWRF